MCSIMGFSKKSRSKAEVAEYFDRTLSRGPDMTRILETPTGWLCFHRLATWWCATASCTAGGR